MPYTTKSKTFPVVQRPQKISTWLLLLSLPISQIKLWPPQPSFNYPHSHGDCRPRLLLMLVLLFGNLFSSLSVPQAFLPGHLFFQNSLLESHPTGSFPWPQSQSLAKFDDSSLVLSLCIFMNSFLVPLPH